MKNLVLIPPQLKAPLGFFPESDLRAQGLEPYDQENSAHLRSPNTWVQYIYSDCTIQFKYVRQELKKWPDRVNEAKISAKE